MKKGYLYKVNVGIINNSENSQHIRFLLKRKDKYFLVMKKINEEKFLGVILNEPNSKSKCFVDAEIKSEKYRINCDNFYELETKYFVSTNINCYELRQEIYETKNIYKEKIRKEKNIQRQKRLEQIKEIKKKNKEKKINNTVRRMFKTTRGITDKNYSGNIKIIRG